MSQPANRSLLLLAVVSIAVLLVGACSSSDAPTTAPAPVATAQAPQQPGAAATAMPGAPAMPAATAMPAPTATQVPGGSMSTEPQYGGVLRAVLTGDNPMWDPARLIWFSGGAAQKIMGDGNLVKGCRTDFFTVCPALAESWDLSADGKEYTFKIRDNARWHDGMPFTNEDAKFFIELSVFGHEASGRNPSSFVNDWGPVTSVDLMDGNRVKVTLDEPRFFLLQTISQGINTIGNPKHLLQPFLDSGDGDITPDQFKDRFDIVATGPYKVDEYDKGSVLKLTRNDSYWAKDDEGRQLPFLDGMLLPIITDGSLGIASLRTGRVDVTGRVNAHAITDERRIVLERSLGDTVKFKAGASPGATGVYPNNLVPPWDDVRVRKAYSLWADRDIFLALAPGIRARAGVWSTTTPWSDPAIQSEPGFNSATKEQDMAEAKRLLTEAGYPDGFETTIMCRDRWVGSMGEPVEDQLRKLGIKVNLEVVDSGTRSERVRNGDFEMVCASTTGQWPFQSATDFLSTSPTAQLKHNDAHVDDLFNQILLSENKEELTRLAHEVERYMLIDQAMLVTIGSGLQRIAFRDYVHGVTVQGSLWLNSDDRAVWMSK